MILRPITSLIKFNQSKTKKPFFESFKFIAWYLFKILFFNTPIPWPYILKIKLLKIFGAKIGKKLIIKPRVNIHFPWNLKIGDYCWLGEEVNIINFENIEIGSNVCISQQVFLCSSSHDFRKDYFPYRHSPIKIKDGVWLQARVFVAPGTTIEEEVIVYPNTLAKGLLKANTIYADSKIKVIGKRWKDKE